jgi:predicted RNA polymerase sigma factor
VSRALGQQRVGTYQIQAAIAAIHDEAPTAAETDWPQILAFYTLLEQMSDNPMVSLNRAIAVAMVRGPAVGLEQLERIGEDARIAGHYRLDAVRAHLFDMLGDRERARLHYRRAADGTLSIPERDYLTRKALAVPRESE